MTDQPHHLYEQTVVKINATHDSAVRARRYNPWGLGLSLAASLAFPILAALAGYQVGGQLGACLAAGVSLPVPVLVTVYAIDGMRVEHQRMVAERTLLMNGPALPLPPALSSVGAPAAPVKLMPGLVQNGNVVAQEPKLSPDVTWLRNACLRLLRGGQVRGAYTRSALAEEPDALMSGEQWDAASPELQRLGYCYVKAGKGGGLLLTPGKDVDECIKLVEVAR